MRALLVVVTFLVLAIPQAGAWAHPGEPPAPHDLASAWNWDPALILGFGLLGWAYWRGVQTLWRRAGRGRGVAIWQVAAFGVGLLALAAALLSPIDAMGEALFAAHMLQHLLLIMVAAPLLVLGAPPVVFIWALNRSGRQSLGRWWRKQPRLAAWWRLVTRPGLIWGVHALAVLAWHLPVLYQAALRNEFLHAAEHISFFGTALLFWWVVAQAGKHGGLNRGVTAFYVFTTAMYGGVLGALITFAQQVWYPFYLDTTSAWGLTTLQDQQLAGVLMWVPGNLIYVMTILLLLWNWFEAMERSEFRRGLPGRKSIVSGILGLAFMLSSCGGTMETEQTAGLAQADPQRGRQAIQEYGCGSCHVIPGVRGADAYVGPPLTDWADRGYIAGALINTPENLIYFIQYPQSVEPGTVMPDMGVTEQDARDIAAYLYTLRR